MAGEGRTDWAAQATSHGGWEVQLAFLVARVSVVIAKRISGKLKKSPRTTRRAQDKG